MTSTDTDDAMRIDSPETTPDNKPGGKGLAVFLLVTFGLAWAIELGPVRMIGYQSKSPLPVLLLVVVMFCPMIGALVARKVEGSNHSDAGLRWGLGRYHLVAWLLPVALSLLATAITILAGLGEWDPNCSAFVEKFGPEQREAFAAMQARFGAAFPLLGLLSAMTGGVVITSIATFGEEFGWRGYLQMRLERFGPLGSMVITGAIWGVWHAPIIAQGHNYPGHPVWGAVLFVPWCICVAVILGWMRNASGSVIAPTIAHASFNSPGSSVLPFVAAYSPLIGNIVGLVGVGVMAVVVGVLIATGSIKPRVDGELCRRLSEQQLDTEGEPE